MDNARPLRAPVEGTSSPVGWLLRKAYTSNPFYVLSADLVFIGLRMSLDTSGKTSETWALMLSLLGYTLLLATTATFLIRLGQVWDDVRTLLLLVVAMFLAISVTFDESLVATPRLGTLLYVGGFLFAVGVSEGLLRGIRLRLPALFRVPYYLILSLFFLYPVALTPLLGDPDSPALQWTLFSFSTIAGLAFLSLIPAIRRGPDYVSQNGSPWHYPLYPWVLFGLLGLAVCGRAFYLCISFHYVGKNASIFGLYFLIPFLFAVALLWLEAGLVSRNRMTQRLAISALPGLLILAAIGHRSEPIYQTFLTLFTERLGGSPLFLTLLAIIAVYGISTVRRVPHALSALTLSLLALTFVGPGTQDLDGLVAPRAFPILAVAALQTALAVRRRESWRFAAGAICFLDAATIVANARGWQGHQALLAYHGSLVALLLIGLLFDDSLARLLKEAGAVLLTLFCLAGFWVDPAAIDVVPPEIVRAYPFILIAIAVVYGLATGCRTYFVAASIGLMVWIGIVGWQGYSGLRQWLVGLDWIVCGLLLFAVAAVISLGKTGLWSRWVSHKTIGREESAEFFP